MTDVPEDLVASVRFESTRWGFWRPIGFPCVYEFVPTPAWADLIRVVVEKATAFQAARAYWWPWSEAW